MITEPCRLARADLFAQFPALIDGGYYNRRKIAGTQTWSQHAWGNATDLFGERALLDATAKYCRDNKTRLRINNILWWQRDHYDHIHLDFIPKQTGTPPLPGQGFDMEAIKGIQRSLNGAGYKGKNKKALVVDGDWGENTEFAFAKMCVDAAEGLPAGAQQFVVRSGTLSMEVS